MKKPYGNLLLCKLIKNVSLKKESKKEDILRV